MFQYCPCCAASGIDFVNNRYFYCKACGFTYYHNTAAAVGCIISTGSHIMFLVRAKEPSLGKLDVPGGFIDPGEGALEGLLRECQEEIGWPPAAQPGKASGNKKSSPRFTFFASFPNVYPYKGIIYNTCDLFFSITAPDLTEADLTLDRGENREVRFIRPENIDLSELAFDSTRRAVEAYLAKNKISRNK